MSRPRQEEFAPGTMMDWDHPPVEYWLDRDEQDEYSHIQERPVMRPINDQPIDLTERPF